MNGCRGTTASGSAAASEIPSGHAISISGADSSGKNTFSSGDRSAG